MSDAELVREALLAMGPRPTPLPDSAPAYMRRENDKLIAGWDALDRLSARLERAEEALDQVLDLLVELWHESASAASLAQWLGLTDDEYAAFVERGQGAYSSIIAARTVLAGEENER